MTTIISRDAVAAIMADIGRPYNLSPDDVRYILSRYQNDLDAAILREQHITRKKCVRLDCINVRYVMSQYCKDHVPMGPLE